MRNQKFTYCLSSASALLFASLSSPSLAHANEPAEGEASASGSLSLGGGDGVKAEGEADADAKGGDRSDKKWIDRWAPEAGMWEVGLYGGIYLPGKNHELFEPDLDQGLEQGWKGYGSVAGDIGLRGGYYPLKWLGIEGEFSVLPGFSIDGGGKAFGYTPRLHLVGQLAKWSITPFILVGFGALGVASDAQPQGNGNDVDPALHMGGGVKFFLNRNWAIRLDLRDVVSHKRDDTSDPNDVIPKAFSGHNGEILLGLSYTFGRKKDEAPPPPSDRDGDGFLDPDDRCPDEPGIAPDGCPEGDRDGDGFLDSVDACPDDPGVDPDGCPILDTDGDGLLDPDDQCVEEPENKNGYEDEDGCPDEIPEEIKNFTGVIKGIYFDTNKDTIKPKSERVLNKALKVLQEYSDVRLMIEGYTDSRGSHDHNMDLSRRRAESVKNWMVEHGIEESRLETTGYGPEMPIDTNDTKAGRAKNRRIEFKLLTGKMSR